MKRWGFVAILFVCAAHAESLSLQEAERLTRQHQPSLRQQHASTVSAKARVEELRAPLLPQGVAAAGYQIGTNNQLGFGTPSFTPSGSYSASVGGTQLVYDFGRTWDRFRAAQASEAAQQATEQAWWLGVLFDVRSAYFAAGATQALVEVAQQTLASEEKHLKQIEGFVAVGTRPEIDLAQARTLRANAKVQLITAQSSSATARAQLNLAMGVERDTEFTVSDEVLAEVLQEGSGLDALLDEALKARPEFVSLQQQIRAQQLTVSSVRGGYWPSVGVFSGVSTTGRQPDGPGLNWNSGISLSWNFFSGFATRAQEAQAAAALEGLEAQSDAFRQQVRLAVERARLGVLSAGESLAASGEALANAQLRLRLAEGRYQTGVGTVLELSDAQLALTQASAQAVQAKFNLSSARAALLQALGRDATP
jgi:outer membrane protein